MKPFLAAALLLSIVGCETAGDHSMTATEAETGISSAAAPSTAGPVATSSRGPAPESGPVDTGRNPTP